MTAFDRCPADLVGPITEFWPQEQWENAAAIAELESGFDAFALNDTTTPQKPCGAVIRTVNGVTITAERSVGYFQINACNLPLNWEWQRLYNANHNAGTAHMLWDRAGQSWSPWFFSARKLGLL